MAEPRGSGHQGGETDDRHAAERERKREKAAHDPMLRGNRSVFEIQKAIVRRARLAEKSK